MNPGLHTLRQDHSCGFNQCELSLISVVRGLDHVEGFLVKIPQVPAVQCFTPGEERLDLSFRGVREPDPPEAPVLPLVLVDHDLLQGVVQSGTRPFPTAGAAVRADFHVRPTGRSHERVRLPEKRYG